MSFRTLLVDDEQDGRELGRQALQQHGIHVDTAECGDEAVAKFNANPYDLVITDLRMPGMNGHTLALQLLGKPNPPRILVATGVAEARLVTELMSHGVEDILHKPFDYAVLGLKALGYSVSLRANPDANVPASSEVAASSLLQPLADAAPELVAIERSLVELTDIFQDSLKPLFDQVGDLTEPPEAVDRFITRFAELEEAEEAQELANNPAAAARIHKRIRCHTTATAIPVDRQYRAVGQPFLVPMRDISSGGLRLLHTRAITSGYLALSWPAETLPNRDLSVALQVKRCRAMSPFYDVGGKFVTSD